jgi:RNA polymerase sigma-70 factor (ECF subfamily)
LNDPRNPARPFIDPAEFSRLFESQHLAVFRYIYGMHGGPLEEVEDLTAETFTRAWKARRSFSGSPQAGLSWLIRIARNLVIDASRRRKSRPLEALGANDDEDNAALPAGLPGPEERLLKQQQLRTLADRLGALPQPQQEMLVLRYLLDWSVKDIAAHLDMLENTVSVNIRRALQTLRSSWPEESE